MSFTARWLRRRSLRNLLLGFLLIYGLVLIGLSTLGSIFQNRQLLESQEQVNLTHRVEALSADLASKVELAERRLRVLASGLENSAALAPSREIEDEWLSRSLQSFVAANPDLAVTRVTLTDEERVMAPTGVSQQTASLFTRVESELRQGSEVLYELQVGQSRRDLLAIIGLPPAGTSPVMVTSAVGLPFRPEGNTEAFLINRDGEILWSETSDRSAAEGLVASPLLSDFASRPSVFVAEYSARRGGGSRQMIAQVSPVGDTGWGVLVQQPKSRAFGAARRVFNSTVISALVAVALAFALSVLASRAISQPVQRLSQSASEIAAGNFGERVIGSAVSSEIAGLADSFNLMSERIEDYVKRLRQAAEGNRELFFGSVRALLAAIEAKEPYVRGHSQRVAALSRTVARRLNLDQRFQEQVFLGGLLHDVGKIGIGDEILRKGEALTVEEFEAMKRHTVIGAEIMATIEPLRYSIAAIRWHHEQWDGTGYPDGLHGDAIPLMARIVAIADGFDAMTTQRVYQDPLSSQQAVNIIVKQSGKRYDDNVVEAFLRAYEKGEVAAPAIEERRVAGGLPTTEAIYT